MDYIEVIGGRPLYGELDVQGSKNAVLPMLAACILCHETIRIKRCPKIYDVFQMIKILESIGIQVCWEGSTVVVDGTQVINTRIEEKYAETLRSSIIMLGSMLARVGKVDIAYPGGCSIGARPIDIHVNALSEMNVTIIEEETLLRCTVEQLCGTELMLPFPSVGATENIILAAVLAEGKTVIENAAQEPEIVELCSFLRCMGACITGDGSHKIEIHGVKQLHGVEYTLMSDRIVAGTYLAAVIGCGGDIRLKADCGEQLTQVIEVFKEMGADIRVKDDEIACSMRKRPKAVELICTRPYPGFPTDMQSQIMAVLSVAEGTSLLVENIFEDRYKTAEELRSMGADIQLDRRVAVVNGREGLSSSMVESPDLRGGAALVIAGLMAEGKTIITNIEYINRGYEDISSALRQLGADIATY